MSNETAKKTITLSGQAMNTGIALGEALLFRQIDLDALESFRFPVEDTAKEVERFDQTIAKTIGQLDHIIAQLTESRNVCDIFQMHKNLLEDAAFLGGIRAAVISQKSNIENVLYTRIRRLEHDFRAIEDEAMRARYLDVQDVYHRILRNLLGIDHVHANPFKRVRSPVVLVAERLLPSDLALLDRDKLRGIVVEEAASLSHVAIIVKSLGIPAIMKIPGICGLLNSGDEVILDATEGKVIINPSERQKYGYSSRAKKFKTARAAALTTAAPECRTADGHRITLEANIGSIAEAETAIRNGADGIGLLRSELYYLSRPRMPSLEEEQEFYEKVFDVAGGRPVTVRLLDVGGDKLPPYFPAGREGNPQLGLRGVRYLLKNTDIFRNHVKSIFRACKGRSLRIMVPFITTLEDLTQADAIITGCCGKERIGRELLSIGIMAEVPSVVLWPQPFLRRSDFVTIGTNDLAQYIFAASREDDTVEAYRRNVHPFLFSLVQSIVEAARREGKPVSVCGEMAADPALAPLLAGLGVTALSMQPEAIPEVRSAMGRRALAEWRELAQGITGRNKILSHR